MNIDCPHCGVQGSVDDSFAGRKLRCPECSKVFIVAEEFLPEVDDISTVRQEKLDDENQITAELDETTIPEEEVVAETEETEVTPEVLDEPEEEETISVEEDSGMAECSVCKQSFVSELMINVDSKLYCALCQPDFDDEGLDFSDEEESDELLQMMEETDTPDDADDLNLMDELSEEEDDDEETSEILALMDDGKEGEDEDNDFGLKSCAGCGEAFHPDFMEQVGSDYYCALCDPGDCEAEEKVIEDTEVTEESDSEIDAADKSYDEVEDTDLETEEVEFISDTDFSVGELIKEAWQQVKGVKGTIWGAMLVLILTVSAFTFGGMAASQSLGEGGNTATVAGINLGSQLIGNWLSMLMTGGIMLIGVRHALGQRVSWRMVFAGFSKWLSMTIAIVLQTVLVLIGFMLLIIPGIYLTIGYALALPLILDKGMGPWEALEASRKAIHKKWWTVFGLYVVMTLFAMIATIPAGLGLIWVIPMYFVLIGVLYVRFFGSGEIVDEDLLMEEEVEVEDDLDGEFSEETEEEQDDISEVTEEADKK